MTIFFSKKQKKLMRERKKKKKTHGQGAEQNEIAAPEESNQSTEPVEEKDSENPEDDEGEPSKTTDPNNGTHIYTIPSSLKTTAEKKKFRKDTRRQARKSGIPEDKIVFVDEGEKRKNEDVAAPADDDTGDNDRPTKKRKIEFPSIKELVENEKRVKMIKERNELLLQRESHLTTYEKDRYRALDCEMVGIGKAGKISALARVSITAWDGNVILDTFVKVPVHVTDFRTKYSGVEPEHLKSEKAMEPEECRKQVALILKDKILVGHALSNDLKALLLNHPKDLIRDTANYRPLQKVVNGKWKPRKLRDIVKEHCDVNIQAEGESHDSVDDARAAMDVFKVFREVWEKEVARKQKKK